MDEKITKKAGITDTESTIFVDDNNNNTNAPENSAQTVDALTNSPSYSENSAENSAESANLKDDLSALSTKSNDFYSDESRREFSKAFPSVDVEKLRNKEEFQEFLGILCKNPTLSQAYACYNAIVSSAEKTAEKRVAQAIANARASVGSLSSTEGCEEIFFTKEQVERMSREEIRRNLGKIRSSQAKW